MALKIRRDDDVVVISGKDRGKTGKVLRVDPKKDRVYVEGLNIIKRHQRPAQTPTGPTGRRRHREGRPDPHLQRHAHRSQGQEADARRHLRREDGRRNRVTRRSGIEARLTTMPTTAPPPPPASRAATSRRSAPRSSSASATPRSMQAPEDREGHAEHGPRRGQAGLQDARRRDGAARDDRRPEADDPPRPQVHRPVQGPRGHARRRRRDAAPRARLRVPRPPDHRSRSRVRDFRGLNPRSFDGRGNYAMGIREQIIFPEIDYDAVDQVRGLDVIITTSAQPPTRRPTRSRGAGHAVLPGGQPVHPEPSRRRA